MADDQSPPNSNPNANVAAPNEAAQASPTQATPVQATNSSPPAGQEGLNGSEEMEDQEITAENGENAFLDSRVAGMRTPTGARDLEAVYDISVKVSAVLGKSTMPVGGLLRLGSGSVVELDRKVGEPIDIFVNNRLVARGEVVVVEGRLGVTMTEIVKSDKTPI